MDARCASWARSDTANADYTVTGGGDIYVNGSATTGNHNGHVTANKVTVVGTHGGNFESCCRLRPACSSIPYASMIQPLSSTGLTAKTDPCGTGPTHGPGIYGPSTCRTAPARSSPAPTTSPASGVHKNNTNLSGTGVTLYFTSPNGEFDMKNGEHLQPGRADSLAVAAGELAQWVRDHLRPHQHPQRRAAGQRRHLDHRWRLRSGVPRSTSTATRDFGFNLGPVVVDSATGNGNHGLRLPHQRSQRRRSPWTWHACRARHARHARQGRRGRACHHRVSSTNDI